MLRFNHFGGINKMVRKRNGYDLFQKDYILKNDNEIKRIKPKIFWSGSEYATDAGTKSLKEVIPNAVTISKTAKINGL
mgnify:FL=1